MTEEQREAMNGFKEEWIDPLPDCLAKQEFEEAFEVLLAEKTI